MKMITQLMAALMVMIFCIGSAFAKEEAECNMDKLTAALVDEKEALLLTYSLWEKDPPTCEELAKTNSQIEQFLIKFHCFWKDIPAIKKIELTDIGCEKEELLPLEPLPDNSLPTLAPLPAMPPKKPNVWPPPPKPNRHLLAWLGGIAAGAGGLTLLGVATYNSVEYQKLVDKTRQTNVQLELVDLESQANSKAKTANLFFALGSAAIGLAVVSVVIDFTLLSSDDPSENTSTSVGVGIMPNGASLTVSF